MMKKWTTVLAAVVLAISSMAAGSPAVEFENLGSPLDQMELTQWHGITRDAHGDPWAWGLYYAMFDSCVVGINLKNGKTTAMDIGSLGRPKICRRKDGALFMHIAGAAGGWFYRLDAASCQWQKLGQSSPNGKYVLNGTVGDDGILYVPSYPKTELLRLDTNTGKILPPVVIGDDPAQQYGVQVQTDKNGIVYTSVGLHHMELWSFDPATGRKQQLLPERFTKAAKRASLSLFDGKDGLVYVVCNKEPFRCHPDRLEPIAKVPAYDKGIPDMTWDGREVVKINNKRELVMVDKAGRETRMPTDVRPFHSYLFSINILHRGQIYGGAIGHARLFSYDPATGRSRDFGPVTGGRVQIYDMVASGDDLVVSSYTGAHLDLINLKTGKKRRIGHLEATSGQERPSVMVRGGNGRIYVVTHPIKGRLGGVLAELDPRQDYALREWKDLVPKQSLAAIAPVKGSNLLFIGSDIAGGTSARPVAKEAEVLLFDPDRGEVVWRGKPLAGDTCYLSAVTMADGLICGTGKTGYFVFDPVTRQVVKTGQLPVDGRARIVRQPASDGSLIGHVNDTLFRIVPGTFQLEVIGRHPGLNQIHCHVLLTPDDHLYFGAGPDLWRARIAL